MEVKVLGFGGGCIIDGTQVLVTSGSVSVERSPAMLEPVYLPVAKDKSGGQWRGKNLFADGTMITNGSISFDLTYSSVAMLSASRMLKRGYRFKMNVSDGNNGCTVDDCIATSVNASGSVGGIVTASVSFMSGKEWVVGGAGGPYLREHEPVGYWACGNTNVRDWSLSFSQSVEPMYLNTSDIWPLYMKVGMCDVSLDITTYERVIHNSVVIATQGVIITGYVSSEGYSYNGATDVGTFRHTFTGANELGNPTVVIS